MAAMEELYHSLSQVLHSRVRLACVQTLLISFQRGLSEKGSVESARRLCSSGFNLEIETWFG